jgi:hypothetical protein
MAEGEGENGMAAGASEWVIEFVCAKGARRS